MMKRGWSVLVQRFARRVLIAVGCAALAFGLYAVSATDAMAAPSNNGSAVETIVIPVEGMACVACAATVKKAVKSLAGVSNVEVSLGARSAKVTYAPDKVSPDRIAAAIDEAGYKAGAPRKAD